MRILILIRKVCDREKHIDIFLKENITNYE